MSKSKIEALVDALTVEEQVSLLAGRDFWTTVPIERLGIPSIKVSDGPNGARGGGAFVGGVSAAAFPVGIALAAIVGPRSRRGNRSRARGRGPLQGRARPAGADGQHPPLDAERSQFRVLFGRPFPHQRDRGRLYFRSAGARRRSDDQALHRQRIRSTSAIRSVRTSTSALCARSICRRSRRR